MRNFILISLSLISIIYCFSKRSDEQVVIPNEAIRFRVLANSNSVDDQFIKNEVTKEVQDYLFTILKNVDTISESRLAIRSNISTIEKKVNDFLLNENYSNKFSINYGYNYFPKKTYNGVKYNEGNYESLLITLGEGEGNNWWCVLFPPLCLMDAQESNEVEYKFFVKELIDKYF